MEALWKLEDKWKLSTQEAVLLFACTSSLVIGVCVATVIRKRVKRNRIANQDGGSSVEPSEATWSDSSRGGWGTVVKKALMGSVRWSKASKWEENLSKSKKEQPMPLLVRSGEVGWQSHNSVSPVWQRPILMGEKCEWPRYSGLILYDEQGLPLDHGQDHSSIDHQVSSHVFVGYYSQLSLNECSFFSEITKIDARLETETENAGHVAVEHQMVRTTLRDLL